MKVLTVDNVAEIVKRHGFREYIEDLMKTLERDFGRWQEFNKMPRPTMHVQDGVLELMPICDDEYYSFKYVNCHPKNPASGLMTVVATGQLSTVDTGYPILFSELTLLTAMRTAATSALATRLMARPDSRVLTMIGTGAQSEFQVQATQIVRGITEVRYFDADPKAMDKFERNMKGITLKLMRCQDAEEAVKGADIITVCTACKAHVDVIKDAWVRPGMHINALGGDTVGKTELEISIIPRCRVVVEYFDQSFVEGEIQRFSVDEVRKLVLCELEKLVTGEKPGRETVDEITLFDSVGIGLEDYSTLRLTYDLAERYGIGEERDFVPAPEDPKDLFSVIKG